MIRHFIYFFDDAFFSVPGGKTKELREELIEVLCPGRSATFYSALGNGIKDIRLPIYEAINEVFGKYGVPAGKVWKKKVVEK